MRLIFHNILLIVGGRGYVTPPAPKKYCFILDPCHDNIQICDDNCEERSFGKNGGTCVRENLCCCNDNE